MFNFITEYFKKKESKLTNKITGFEVKFWIDGKLITESFSHESQTFVMQFPYGCRLSKGLIISGYKLEPFIERI